MNKFSALFITVAGLNIGIKGVAIPHSEEFICFITIFDRSHQTTEQGFYRVLSASKTDNVKQVK